MNKRHIAPYQDDGQVIADMSLAERHTNWLGERSLRRWRASLSEDSQARERTAGENAKPALSRAQQRQLTWGALKAALLVGGGFIAVFALLLLAAAKLWLN
ncbi:MAG: hypothetical protein Q4B96_02625 [Bacillota bacterium]|nr:hypothetical protein [Bacillota bacterium]